MNLVGLKTAFKEAGNLPESIHKYVVGFNPHGLIEGLTTSGDSALQEMIEERLRVFEAQIGYPTDVTANNVKLILKNSLMAFAALLQIKKWDDSKNLVLGNGKKATLIGAYLPTFGINAAPTVINVDFAGPFSTMDGWEYVSQPAVSNTVWSNLVGSLQEVAILPPALANLTSYLVSNFFSNHYNDDDGVSQLVEFIPNFGYATKPFLDVFNDSVEEIRDLYNSKPGLYSFMIQFFPRIELDHDDFKRDLSGRTITIIDDTKLLQSFDLNPTLYMTLGKDSMLTYGDENLVASVFDSTPTQLFDISTVFYELIFKEASGGPSNAILRSMNYIWTNTEHARWALPHGRLSNASAFSATQLNTMMDAMDKYPFDCVYRATYGMNSTTLLVELSMNDLDLKQGFNLYIVNGDDVGQVRDSWFKSAILGLPLPGTVNRVENEGLIQDSAQVKGTNRRKQRKNSSNTKR